MTTAVQNGNSRLRMADLELDLAQRRLLRKGEDLKLSKLTFRLVRTLASAAPALVTKDELADAVWDGRIVSPETVAQRIKLLRQALQDDAQAPRYIEVVRGQGYRWIPEVEQQAETQSNGATFVGNEATSVGVDMERPAMPSIVILPFDSLGNDNVEQRVFAEGLTHDLITNVGRTRSLFVVGRGSSFMYRGSGHPASDVARQLGVRYVAQGSVMFSGNRIRVNAAVTDTDSDQEIWAQVFEQRADDVFSVMDETGAAIVANIDFEVNLAEQNSAALRHPDSLDAWSAYHRGWWHLNSFSPDCFEQGDHYFRLALELDPESARALAGLSTVSWLKGFLEIGDRSQAIDECMEHAVASVRMDDRDPLAHWALGRALHLAGEFDRSVAEYELANRINPSFAFGLFSQGFAAMLNGQHGESNGLVDKARRLSPFDPMSYAKLGVRSLSLAMLGEYEQAADMSIQGAGVQAIKCQMFPAIAAICNVLAERNELASNFYERLLEERPGYEISDYLRAFPHRQDKDVALIENAFESLRKLA